MKSLDEISTLLAEQRRKLGIEQKDMYMRIGMKQQQYQRIESGSDVKLSTLLRVLEGLDLELSISPKQSKGHTAPIEDAFKSQSQEPKSESLHDDEDDLGFWFGSEDK
ncbi:helix-turn-helix domain-containing protein [Vibrio hangzhouensis]|uniref:helix-turn-helix domain-containing protein n=1 Tax=Vibrio hangzhouensis TaxID=462991 RepID=UPI001C948B3E|nr:helix-turn-helix transcriptional regulator [Vibrio hangzhouensis]MBY6199357.1 helix-turn-helix transcriptional regulator [Vibrio hangzhouensis]